MQRTLAVVIALSAVASLTLSTPADAQIIRVPERSSQPVAWASLSAGLFRVQNAIYDGRTESEWRFGSALQYRGSLEMDVGGFGAAGLAVGYADAPLTYRDVSLLGGPVGCERECDAHAQIWSVMANFRMGGGVGFHQVIDVSAGTTIYRDFRSDVANTPLGPESPDKDLSLAIGYGFGWGFGPRMQLMVVQEAAYTLHQRDGLRGSGDASNQLFTTRIGARVGFGSKRR